MKRTAVLLIVVLAAAVSLQCGGGDKPAGGLAKGIVGEWALLGQERPPTLTVKEDPTHRYIITLGEAQGVVGEWTRTRYSLGQEQLLTLNLKEDSTYRYVITLGETEHYTEEGTYSVAGDILKIMH